MLFHPRLNIETIRLITRSSIHNLLLGAGICYTIQSKQYLHIPLVVLSPATYTGYHCYKNKEYILDWFRK
jgi:hypothetical protein